MWLLFHKHYCQLRPAPERSMALAEVGGGHMSMDLCLGASLSLHIETGDPWFLHSLRLLCRRRARS